MADIHDEIIKSQFEQALHVAEATGQDSLIQKAFTDLIEKGKKAVLGEIRTYSGVQYKKMYETGNPNKDWVRVKSDTPKASKSLMSEADKGVKKEEKTQNLDQAILEAVDPLVQDWVTRTVDSINARNAAEAAKKGYKHRLLTAYDRKMIYLGTVHKLLGSIFKYAKPTDKLEYINPRIYRGETVIESVISREGKRYRLNTQVIGAGGYAIQVYHLRYLTDTDLPSGGDTSVAKKYDEKIKKMTKAEKINQDILYQKGYIERLRKEIDEINGKSDEQIVEESWFGKKDTPTWAEIVERGADKNFDYKEENYIAQNEKYRREAIEHERAQVKRNEHWIKVAMKDILKYEKRLQDLNLDEAI